MNVFPKHNQALSHVLSLCSSLLTTKHANNLRINSEVLDNMLLEAAISNAYMCILAK